MCLDLQKKRRDTNECSELIGYIGWTAAIQKRFKTWETIVALRLRGDYRRFP
jgi:hypothetical protein